MILILSLLGLPGIAAFSMARVDLELMERGQMEKSGRRGTVVGTWIGLFHCCLWLAMLALRAT